MIFLFPENMILFFRQKMEDDLSQEIHGNMIFSVHSINVTNMILHFCKKNQRWCSPEKIHLKVINILDRILESVPTIQACNYEGRGEGGKPPLPFFENRKSALILGKKDLIVSIFGLNIPSKM